MRSATGRVLALALLSTAIGGCSSTGIPAALRPSIAPYVLTVDDRSSWGTLRIMIGDRVVGSVGCSESATVTPGASGVPSLPWTVRLVTASGQTVDQRIEDGLDGPRWVLVFDTQVGEGGSVALGPVPPCAMPSPSLVPIPTAGIPIADAIERGRGLVAASSAEQVAIQSATIGRLDVYTTVAGADPLTPVWALKFSGAFADPSTCVSSPPASPCPSQASALLVLDFATGAKLALIVPAPLGS